MRYIYIFILSLLFIGCRDKNLTKSLQSIYKYQDTTINLVIKEKSKSGKRITLIGEELFTKYSDTSHYLIDNYALFEEGDTIVKDKGSLYIKIKKNNKMYLINFDDYGKSKLDSILYL